MEFLKFFGAVLLVAGPIGLVTGLLPYPVLVVVALVLLGVGIHYHRNRSLV